MDYSGTGTYDWDTIVPVWTPAEQEVPHLLSELMYMGRTVHDGVTIHQYKHHFTRNYINLDDSGRAWDLVFTWASDDEPNYAAGSYTVSARQIALAEAEQALDLHPDGYADL